MADTSVVFNILAKDNATSVFNKVGRSIGTIAGGVVGGQALMGGLSKAFSFAKGAAIDFNSQLQNSTIAFTTMLGSGKQARTFLDQLQAFAKSTPFEFGDLVQNAQQMMGMGIAAKDVIPDLRALGDSVASVGGSAQQVDQVTLAFDQMAAKGKLDMGNMNQLMQGGVPSALKILADSFHVTTGQMIDMISHGKVASSEALPLLVQGIEHGTKSVKGLGGMMDKQSQTFSGAISNISDSLTQALAQAFRPFFGIVSGGAQKLASWLGSPTFAAFGKKISSGLSAGISAARKFVSHMDFTPVKKAFSTVWQVLTKDLIPSLKDLWKTFGPLVVTIGKDLFGAIGKAVGVLKPLGGVIKDVFGFVAKHKTTFQAIGVAVLAVVGAFKAWTIATQIWSAVTKVAAAVQFLLDAAMDANPIGLIILAVIGLVAAIVYLWTHSTAFRNFFIGLWHGIWGVLKAIGHWFAHDFVDFFKNAWHWILDKITSAALWIHGKIEFIKAVFRAMWEDIKHRAHAAVSWIHDKFTGFIDFFKKLPGRITSVARGMWDGLKNAFKAVVNWIVDKWNNTVGKIRVNIPTWVPGVGGKTFAFPTLPHLVTGGDITRAGIATVGENGPETVLLPAGARVLPHGTGVGAQRIEVVLSGDTPAIRALLSMLAAEVRGSFHGNVTLALGGHT